VDRPAGPTPRSFGALLRGYREAAGLTQEELAERAELSARGLRYLERDLRRPYRATARRLAATLALPAEERAHFEMAGREAPLVAVPAPGPVPSGLAASGLAPLVGRHAELALLERHLAGEGPPVLVVAGEPGIGKSRLLREAVELASRGGWAVLEGGCTRRGGQDAYTPLTQAVQQSVRPGTEETVLAGCAWLVRLLPELASGPIEPLPAWALAPEQERRLMFAAVGRVVTNLAGPAGTLLVLDDLQWAGADALDLLLSLLRGLATIPLRVVGAYRDSEVAAEGPLAAMLADLAHAGLVRHHALAPLRDDAVDRLLAALLDDVQGAGSAVRTRVRQRTGGVPFFVVSCAQALRTNPEEAAHAEAVPWDVAQGIRQRVATLPEAARMVLSVAAVMGRVFQPSVLIAVVEQPESTVLAGLEAAGRARLLVGAGSAYQFAHDLIREVVEADVGAARQLVLHRRIAETLEEDTGEPPVELLAYHYARSSVDDKALLYLKRAGDRAEARAAYAAAEGYYRELVARLDHAGQVRAAARLCEKLGQVLIVTARYAEALVVLERTITVYQAENNLDAEGRVAARIGRAHASQGTPEVGLTRLQRHVDRLEAGAASPSLAALYTVLADIYAYTGAYREGLAAAKRAVDIARQVGHDTLLADAQVIYGDLLSLLGRGEEALSAFQAGIAVADTSGNVRALADGLNGLAHFYVHLGEFGPSIDYIDRAHAVATRAGVQEWIAFHWMHRGFIHFSSGDWGEARRNCEQALALYDQIAAIWSSAHPLMTLGLICYGEGDWDAATSYLTQSVVQAARARNREALLMAHSVLGELELRLGRFQAAQERLTPLLDGETPWGKDMAFVLPKVAWAYLEAGEHEVATRVAAQAVLHAQVMSDRLNLVEALRVQALVTIRQQGWAEAACSLNEALTLAQAMQYPWGEARILTTYGELGRRRGERELARQHWEAAQEIFRRLGARKDAEMLQQELARLGLPG